MRSTLAEPATAWSLKRRREGGDELLAYRAGDGWRGVSAADINDYLREISGGDHSAPRLGAEAEFGQPATQGRIEQAVRRLLRRRSPS